MAWNYAISTPEPCQDLTVAALRDAWDRRSLRATSIFWLFKLIWRAITLPTSYLDGIFFCDLFVSFNYLIICFGHS